MTEHDDGWEQGLDRPMVWFGSRNEHVRAAQEQLARLGLYDDKWGEIPGAFGPRTDAAVRAFQTQAGINSDGIVEGITWMNLYSWPDP